MNESISVFVGIVDAVGKNRLRKICEFRHISVIVDVAFCISDKPSLTEKNV